MTAARIADPYRDLTVIDSRAPRFNQAVIGVVALLAVATGWWWLIVALAANLALGLTLGRRFCVTCVAYFAFVQPLVGWLWVGGLVMASFKTASMAFSTSAGETP